ncbi:uncharacterized protein TNCT_179021 [Trichonephila clavata]|uniref:Uncharacterized protein n=1 Tax=Trichonephila clavata TaxID=2740835 RepID=A0A8X6H266_TRICU|nr:uncharacterized protein TNCT_179021 [Trichonephila clavata]
MILAIGLLALLVSTNTCSAAIKGGRIIQEPAVIQDVSQPHVHVSKGGGGGALHHTAVVQDPISGPVVVEKVSSLGSSGGIKTAGLGAGSAQYTLGDGLFGQRQLYRTGPAQYPFGLLGSDYYSYPNSLLTAPRVLRRKTVSSNNLSGLRPVGFSGLKGGVIADPTTSQFSIGDAQIKTNVFGARRNIYRTGLSPVPFGLMGLDYYSYPKNLLLQRQVDDGFGLRQTNILGGGLAFSAGDSQIRGPIGQEKVTVVETDPLSGGQRVTTVQQAPSVIPQQVSLLDDGAEFGQRKVTTTTITESADPVAAALGEKQITQTTVTKGGSGLRGGNIILSGGPAIGGLRRVKTRPALVASQPAAVILQETSGLAPAIGGFGQRQVVTKTAPAPVIAQAPIVQTRVAPTIVSAPSPVVVQAPIQRRVIARRPGDVFLSQVARPRVATIARPVQVAVPVAQQRVVSPIAGNVQFTLGGSQLIGGPVVAQAPVFAAPRPTVIAAAPRPAIFAAPRPTVIAQAPVIAAAPRPAVISQAPIIAAPRPAVISQAPIIAAPRPAVISQAPIIAAPRPTIISQAPQVISQVKTSPGLIGRSLFGRRAPQVVYVDGGRQFLGIDIIGGSRIGDPRYGYTQLPISTSRFANLGLSQARIPVRSFASIDGQGSIDAGPTLLAPAQLPIGVSALRKSPVLAVSAPVAKTVVSGPSKIGGPVIAGPLGLTSVGGAPSKTITQEEVVGPAGDLQTITTVTETDSNRLVGSKIGGAAISSPLGFAGIGQTGATKTITQEEVVGPLGDPQVVTTVTKSAPAAVVAGPSKIGGFATGGLAAIGQAPTKVVTQEEVVGPAGDLQTITTVTETDSNRLVGSKIGGPVISSPLGFAGIGQTGATKTITQEEVVGPLGDPQVVTTVTKSAPAAVVAGPSKIGGFATGGLAAIGQAPTKVVTQEEVVGPAGDLQTITTVTETDSNRLVGSKIGGPVISSPLGFAGIGQTGATKTITQEEVVGPLGDPQVVTTVTKTEPAAIVAGPSKIGGLATGGPLGVTAIAQSAPATILQQEEIVNPITGLRTTSQLTQEITQDPIETAISQAKLGGSIIASPLSQTVQSLVDPLGSGQTQVSLDNILDDPSTVTQVKETTFAEPGTGTITKVTEVSKGGVGDSIVQQNIADAVVQESISPAFGGGLRFSPRVTFLSQHPYDVPDSSLLRSVITRPVIQQQQELEQILVK